MQFKLDNDRIMTSVEETYNENRVRWQCDQISYSKISK